MRRTAHALLSVVLLFSLMPAGLLAPASARGAIPGGYYPIAAWPDGAGAFASPVGIAVDASGNVYVADTQNHRVKKISPTGTVLALWGTRGAGTGQFYYPEGIAVDVSGRVFVADTGNHRVQVFSSAGAYLATWGAPGTTAGKFQAPTGLAIDAAGSLFVSDTANGRVQKFSSAGVYLSTVGAPGAANGQLDGARGIAVDASGFLYVADMNNRRVQKFSSAGAYVTQWGPTVAPNGTPTGSRYIAPVDVAADTSGNIYVADSSGHFVERCSNTGASPVTWGSLGSGAGQFSAPSGVVAKPGGGIYVTDTGNNRVETLSAAGAWVASWSGRGSAVGSLDSPSDVAGSGGSTYVADTGNNRVQVIDATGVTVGGFGSAGSAAGQLNGPRGISVAGATAWVADTGNNRIQTFTTAGVAVAVYGSAGAALGQYASPEGIAVEAAGTVLIADTGNNRIQRLSAAGVATAAFGAAGSGNGQFNAPCAVAAAPDGSFYVVDRGNNRIQKFSSAGVYVTQWGGWGIGNGQFKAPAGVAVDASGDVYVSDPGNSRVQRFDSSGTFIAAFGTAGAALGNVNWPLGLDVDATGRILVSERDNHRVQVFGYDGTAPSTTRSGTPVGYDFAWVTSDVTVTLAPTDAGSGVATTFYQLDASAWTTYTAPFTVSAQGQTRVRYYSVDRMGNVEPTTTFFVRIDSVPPSGTFVVDGGATYATSATVQAHASFTDAVSMRIDPGSGVYGAWTAYSAVTPVVVPGAGVRTIRAQFRDSLGNTSSYEDSITVDVSPPVSSVTGVPGGWATSAVTLGFSALDDVSGVDRILVSHNGGPEAVRTSLTASAEGTNTVTYRAIDRAGNAEPTQTVVFAIDTIPPTGSLVLAGGAPYSRSASVTARSNVVGATEMRFDLGSGPDAWRSFVTTETLVLPAEGSYTVTGHYRDLAGLSLTATSSVVYDMTSPVTTIAGVPAGWATSAPVNLTWSASDAVSGVSQTLVSVNGAPEAPRTSLALSTEGTNTITYRSLDLAGNAEETRTVTVRIDTIAPSGTLSLAGGAAAVTTTTVAATSAVIGALEMRIDTGAGYGAWMPFSADTTLTLSGDGPHTVTAQYRDEAGLTHTTTDDIVVDYTAPVTSVSGLPEDWSNTPVTLGFSAVDDFVGVDRILVSVNGGPEAVRSSLFISDEGTTTVAYRAIDLLGNAEETSTVVVRLDSVPPFGALSVLGAPYSQSETITARSNITGATEMRFDLGAGYDEWRAFAALETLDVSAEGTFTVTAQYRDEAGLVYETYAVVTVDHTAPVSEVSGVPVGWSTSSPVTLGFGATDNISGIDRILVSVNGAPEAPASSVEVSSEGTNTVTFRAIDKAGNAEETRTVEVLIDTIAPSGALALDGGASYATSTTVTAGSAVSGAREMRFDLGSGFSAWTPFAATTPLVLGGEGRHTVVANYRDQAGLMHETSATIVVDMTAPVMGALRLEAAQSWRPRFQGTRAMVNWSATDANPITGYSWIVDRVPTTVPDTLVDGTTESLRVDGRAPGTWYVHVRARDAAGLWGNATHLKVTLVAPLRTLTPPRDPALVAATGRSLSRAAIGSTVGVAAASELRFETGMVDAQATAAPAAVAQLLPDQVAAAWWPARHTSASAWMCRHE